MRILFYFLVLSLVSSSSCLVQKKSVVTATDVPIQEAMSNIQSWVEYNALKVLISSQKIIWDSLYVSEETNTHIYLIYPKKKPRFYAVYNKTYDLVIDANDYSPLHDVTPVVPPREITDEVMKKLFVFLHESALYTTYGKSFYKNGIPAPYKVEEKGDEVWYYFHAECMDDVLVYNMKRSLIMDFSVGDC